jgi:hypothetical protein
MTDVGITGGNKGNNNALFVRASSGKSFYK